MKVRVTLDLTAEEIDRLKKFASEHYKPSLGIDWRCVAAAWAEMRLKEAIAKHAEIESVLTNS